MSETTKTLTEALIKGKLPDLFTSRGTCADFNTCTTPGGYTAYQGAANTPKDVSGVLIVLPAEGLARVQIFVVAWVPEVYIRPRWNTGAWGPWRSLSCTKLTSVFNPSESGGGNLLHLNAFYAERRAA